MERQGATRRIFMERQDASLEYQRDSLEKMEGRLSRLEMQIGDEPETTELVVNSTTNPDCISHAATIHAIVKAYYSGQGARFPLSNTDKIPEILTSQSVVRRSECLLSKPKAFYKDSRVKNRSPWDLNLQLYAESLVPLPPTI